MAAPGTITHVLEVAAQLAAANQAHQAAVAEAAAAVTVDHPELMQSPPPA